tara:strand:+ start:2123 stop:2317 length:195 start_codon:yes stop_codon:yes gene_type:complete
MYDYNNIDKSKEDGLQEWYQEITSTPHNTNTNPHRRERDIHSILGNLLKLFPTNSTKGTSKYHR